MCGLNHKTINVTKIVLVSLFSAFEEIKLTNIPGTLTL